MAAVGNGENTDNTVIVVDIAETRYLFFVSQPCLLTVDSVAQDLKASRSFARLL